MHSAFRHYIKTLLIDLAFVITHIGDLDEGIDEFDDQLNIKLKILREEEEKRKNKHRVRMHSIVEPSKQEGKQIGAIKEMKLEK